MGNRNEKLERMRQAAQSRAANTSLRAMTAQAAAAQAGSSETIIWLPLNQIVVDQNIQVRVGGTDPETVERYAVFMFESRGWGDFPPVDVHRDDERGYLLSAGYHRIEAAQLASQMLIDDGGEPILEIPCVPRPGGYQGALEHAEEDNLSNAKELTNKDRFEIFKRRVLRGHRWARMTDGAVSGEVGVKRQTISNWRAKVIEQARATGKNLPVDDTAPRIGADGREYNVVKIQDANRQRAQSDSEFDPDPASPAPTRNDHPNEPAGRFEENPPSPPPTPLQRDEFVPGDASAPADATNDHAPAPTPPPAAPSTRGKSPAERVLEHLEAAVQLLDEMGENDKADGLHDWTGELAQAWGMTDGE